MQDTLNTAQKAVVNGVEIDVSHATMLDLNRLPPKGWTFREPSLNWTNPDPLNGQGFDHAVMLIAMVRAQNPAANLDPSLGACAKDLIAFTAARLNYHPRFVGLPSSESSKIDERYRNAGKKCASCGR